MPNYTHALFIDIEADSYEDSLREAKSIAAGLTGIEQIPVTPGFMWAEEEDNDGQRVYYLHPEGTDNSWEPTDD